MPKQIALNLKDRFFSEYSFVFDEHTQPEVFKEAELTFTGNPERESDCLIVESQPAGLRYHHATLTFRTGSVAVVMTNGDNEERETRRFNPKTEWRDALKWIAEKERECRELDQDHIL